MPGLPCPAAKLPLGCARRRDLPIAPAVAAQTATAPVETVGWRCGPGWHVNPWGRCVPNRRVYYRPYYRPYYHRHYYHRGYYHRGFHRGYYHRRRW
ncbi:GCG_CRPN prefix-to-repeats domain-containing protein [Rhodoblastus sp.]|uniref:GCG_CRPN prefix-to-repeats domain-containing protein n=1 Tax=Rhodoblastus sp. TaxID=1962975 RepID=UPI003F99E783